MSHHHSLMSRRAVLEVLGGATGAVFLHGCGGSGSSGGTAATAAIHESIDAMTSATGACTVTPEGEIGSNFTDDGAAPFNRSDVRSNLDGGNTQSGIPLTLYLTVLDTQNACVALEGIRVDLWQCNADGVYSGEALEGTTAETWLRGWQLTDSAGQITFLTVFPGWYAGRTTHLHLRVRSTSGSYTTQLFFPQFIVDAVNATIAPYSARGTNPSTNATDPVEEAQTEFKTEVTLSGSPYIGYTASMTLGLPMTRL